MSKPHRMIGRELVRSYISWRLLKGDSLPDAIERAKHQPGFPHLKPSQWNTIGNQAYKDHETTIKARMFRWSDLKDAADKTIADILAEESADDGPTVGDLEQ